MQKFIKKTDIVKGFIDRLKCYYYYKGNMEFLYKKILFEVLNFRTKFLPICIYREGYEVDEKFLYIFNKIITSEAIFILSRDSNILRAKSYATSFKEYVQDTKYHLDLEKDYTALEYLLESGRILSINAGTQELLFYKLPDYLQLSIFKRNLYVIQCGFLQIVVDELNVVDDIIKIMYTGDIDNIFIPFQIMIYKEIYKVLQENQINTPET